MSRGLGSRQRAVLDAIDALGGSASVLELARRTTGKYVDVGTSDYEATRRAVQGLCRRGLLRPFESLGSAIRYSVRYSDGTLTAHKRFARPKTIDEFDRRQDEKLMSWNSDGNDVSNA